MVRPPRAKNASQGLLGGSSHVHRVGGLVLTRVIYVDDLSPPIPLKSPGLVHPLTTWDEPPSKIFINKYSLGL